MIRRSEGPRAIYRVFGPNNAIAILPAQSRTLGSAWRARAAVPCEGGGRLTGLA